MRDAPLAAKELSVVAVATTFAAAMEIQSIRRRGPSAEPPLAGNLRIAIVVGSLVALAAAVALALLP